MILSFRKIRNISSCYDLPFSFSKYSLGDIPNSSLNTLVKYFGVEKPTRMPSSMTLMAGSWLAMRHASLRRTEVMKLEMFCPVMARSLL